MKFLMMLSYTTIITGLVLATNILLAYLLSGNTPLTILLIIVYTGLYCYVYQMWKITMFLFSVGK